MISLTLIVQVIITASLILLYSIILGLNVHAQSKISAGDIENGKAKISQSTQAASVGLVLSIGMAAVLIFKNTPVGRILTALVTK